MRLFRASVSIFIIVLIITFSLLTAFIISDFTSSISSRLNSEYDSCIVQKPSRAIIFRLDDVGDNRLEASKMLTNTIQSNGFRISLGVIPSRLDLKTILWLRSLDSNTEIAMHGYDHIDYEFETLTKNEAKDKLEAGRNQIYYKTGHITSTFIPPNNRYSAGTLEALDELGFKIISAKEKKLDFNSNPALVGYNAATTNLNNMLNSCESSLDKNGICTIMVHPQDFFDYKGSVNENNYNQFLFLLDSLKTLNATPKTFKDLIKC